VLSSVTSISKSPRVSDAFDTIACVSNQVTLNVLTRWGIVRCSVLQRIVVQCDEEVGRRYCNAKPCAFKVRVEVTVHDYDDVS
jgi:hypothetical protein